MEQWYTLHTKPNAEYQVVRALTQRQIHTYLPEVDLPEMRQGRKPFFPCYLFARVDFSAVSLSSLAWTPGLRRVVSFGEQPTPVPDEIIEWVQSKLAEIETAENWPAAPTFKPGDTLRIIEGPFQDMVAIFEGPTSSARRVHILLNILGHLSRVQVDPVDLVKTEAEVEAPRPKRPRRTRGGGRRI